MVSNYDPHRVSTVACPSCGAQPGERCRSKAGKERNHHDFHATRKAALYPEFADGRQGVPRQRAEKVVEAIEAYVNAKVADAIDITRGKICLHVQEITQARQAMLAAIKEICE